MPLTDVAGLREALYRYVAPRVAQPADADDVVQDILERLHRHLAQVREPDRVDAWLARTARNALTDQYRRRKTRPRPTLALPDSIAEDEDDAAIDELTCCLEPLIDRLPAEQAQALRRTHLADGSQAAAARAADLSASGMRSRVQRARRALRQQLEACCALHRDAGGRITEIGRPAACGCGGQREGAPSS